MILKMIKFINLKIFYFIDKKKTLEKVLTMCGVIKVSKQKLIPSVCFLLKNKIIYFYVIYFLGKNNKHSQNVNKFSEKYIKDDKLFDEIL